MVTEFLEGARGSRHEAFQRWRREHPAGYILAFQTRSSAKLHLNGGCHHPGEPKRRLADGGGSLTRKRKVCAEDAGTLVEWAQANSVVWSWCVDCARGLEQGAAPRSEPRRSRGHAPAPSRFSGAGRLDVLRHTPGYAAALFEAVCGSKHVEACAAWLADAVAHAVECDGAWGTTLVPSSIRLNVGPVRLLNFSPTTVWFATTDDVGKVPSWLAERRVERDSPTLYRSVPVPTRDFLVETSMVHKLPSGVARAFRAYIAAAAARRRGPSLFVHAHSPGVIAFINEFLGRDLPNPEGSPVIPPPDAEEVSSPREYVEGRVRTFVLESKERRPENRMACIAAHGTRCSACGMSFEERYGSLGEGFIEVHHLDPLASAKRQRTVDPVRDLVPVCPNCHRMLHRRSPPLTPAELAKHLKRRGG